MQTKPPLQLLVGLGGPPEPAHPHRVVTEPSNTGDTTLFWPQWPLDRGLNLA